ncbi:MAG: hypothetical protein IPO44_08885 [Candidatus Microthrix sp.]|nr:hypothetical protein [Candidatus Microthrix sp.]MBK9559656.1 hypothetical protein [Candidatus Microthrix sp.]
MSAVAGWPVGVSPRAVTVWVLASNPSFPTMPNMAVVLSPRTTMRLARAGWRRFAFGRRACSSASRRC